MNLLRSASLLALATAALSASAQNLVQNPGFENGSDIAPWTTTGIVEASNLSQRGGTRSALFLTDGTLTQTLATQPNAPYTFSFYLSEVNVVGSSFAASVNGNPVLSLTNRTGSSAGYVLYSFPVTAATGSTTISFARQNNGDRSGFFFLDDVSVTPRAVPEPTTFAALGLGAVAMLRRRKRS